MLKAQNWRNHIEMDTDDNILELSFKLIKKYYMIHACNTYVIQKYV